MIGFYSAGHRTIFLPISANEWLVALLAVFGCSMPYALMVMGNGTRAAIKRLPQSFCATINAMFWVFAGSREFMPVQFFVAGNTKRKTIIKINNQFGIIGNWLYMMSVNFSADFSAFLASVAIAPINFISPFGKVALRLSAFINQGFTALPMCSSISGHRFSTTRSRAITRCFISTIEGLVAIGTLAWLGWVTMRPTFPRTIFRIIGTVKFYFINCSAYLANLFDLSIYHSTIISPYYCSIQRWTDMTGGIPELVE